MGSKYTFVTHWRFEASAEEVYNIIDNGPDFVRWWPAVWLRIETVEPGDENGIGKLTDVLSKGWLPYLLRWQARADEKVPHSRIALSATGDFEGNGLWTFREEGSHCEVQYDWEIIANKAVLRYLSFLLKPLFAANHNWAMARGEESLRLELARRRATTEEERAQIPPPPPPRLSRRQRRKLGLPEPSESAVGR